MGGESLRRLGWGLAGDFPSPRLQNSSLTLSKKLKLKRENPDLLELCHTVPMEVVAAGEVTGPGRLRMRWEAWALHS